MSGICGLFNLNDKPVAESETRAMTAMLERRGPDATRQWCEGPIGLGHTLLATTPELLFENQPFEHAATGCVITADVRLDNRDQLIAALALGREPGSIGDAELILIAYLNWGEDCPDRLLGDFAFAVWDPRSKKLLCARDHSGMRQLYYHHAQGKRFVFATDARAILVLPQVPYQINEGRIADFIVGELEWIDYDSTFFEDVFRLPPGHKATVTPDGLRVSEYWRPAPVPRFEPLTDDEYKEGFLEIFTQAVDDRLRVPSGKVGSMLSGGMDSGSVVAVAKDLLEGRGQGPLHTYSCTSTADPNHMELAEIRSITAATSMESIAPTLIHPESLLDQFETMVSEFEEPFDGQCMLLRAAYRAAAADGRRVVLDGAGGDLVLSEGSYIVRLLRSGHFPRAMKEIVGESHFWESNSTKKDAFRYVRSAIAPEFMKRLRRERIGRKVENLIRDSLISHAFADDMQLSDRVQRYLHTFPGGRAQDYAIEYCGKIRPYMTAGRERYARIAATTATEASDPFLDKRVIDYCSRLPGRFRLRDGWPKIILRDLMAGRLPEEVRWARGKHHLGWEFNTTVTGAAIAQGAVSIGMLQTALKGYVDSEKLENAWRMIGDSVDIEPIHTAYLLSAWLRKNVRRPVVTS